MMKATEEAGWKKRQKFEEGIKRPYFHVKPLERGQLKNWNEYLEFMKEHVKDSGDLSEVLLLTVNWTEQCYPVFAG